MFTSSKVVGIVAGLYFLVVLLPAIWGSSEVIPASAIGMAVAACLFFVAGTALGGVVFRWDGVRSGGGLQAAPRAFVWLVGLLVMIVAYVLAAGPTPPMVEAFTNPDSFAIALLREDALKLNEDELFVRVYSWGRDLVAPVVVVLSLHAWRTRSERTVRAWAVAGLAAAFFLGLWSGQKATVVNYLLAAFIFLSRDLRSMALQLAKLVPVLVVVIVATFAVTQPDLFLGDSEAWPALEVLWQSIVSRLLWVPLEVAAAFVHSADDLGIVRALDVVPYLSFLWTPGILSIENRVAIEFYHQGIDSGHSNALAFAYAYVLGGLPGCAIGGLAMMGALRCAVLVVRATRSPLACDALGAYLCYVLLDMLNSNFIQYMVKILVLALLTWLAVQTWRWWRGPAPVLTDAHSAPAR
ncbi:MAG: hypothetical protein JNJ89_10110 [Rubrivivax sp.]|nr:hypothetical protein [Rubrivivax sp.]